MKSALVVSLWVLFGLDAAVARPAPWYQWKSLLDGQVVCAQAMQGEWKRVGGPFKDARCEKRGVPGR